MGKLINLENKKYNRLMVIKRIGTSNNGRAIWECECDCGNTCNVYSDKIKSGHTKSCGCLQKETVSKNFKKHGEYNSHLYRVWRGMKERCYNVNHVSAKYYYNKGIGVCNEWLEFMGFRDWAIVSGYKDCLSIDRINPNGNYEPSNCQWITLSENSKKRHTDKKVLDK